MKKIFYFYFLSINFKDDYGKLRELFIPSSNPNSLFIKFSRGSTGFSMENGKLGKFFQNDIFLIQDYPIIENVLPLSSGRPIPVKAFSVVNKEIEISKDEEDSVIFRLFGFQEEIRKGNWKPWIKKIIELYDKDEAFNEIRCTTFF